MKNWNPWKSIFPLIFSSVSGNSQNLFEEVIENPVQLTASIQKQQELPEEDRFNYLKPKGGIKEIRTVGDKWATFQTLNFRNNSKPYYVLLDSRLNVLN